MASSRAGAVSPVNVFVIGLEDFNAAHLETVRQRHRYAFHPLLTFDEATHPARFPVPDMLHKAERQLRAFEGHVDAIVSHWDFPSSMMVPVLRRERGQPGPTLESVLKCEHKYWARVEQREVVPQMVPPFAAVDPFADDPLAGVDVPYPFWVKPVKAHSSYLGFRIHDRAEFDRAMALTRDGIAGFAEALDHFLDLAELPPEIAAIDGRHCIAESIISRGHQCTLEGFVMNGRPEVYGVVDSIREGRHMSCFQRYQYPSKLPRRVQARMIEAATRVMRQTGYDAGPFNIEFYWNGNTDEIKLLEVNCRISKSHCPLFHMVDGATNQQVMIETALGRRPDFPHREGAFKVAGKFMLRFYEDGVVGRVPAAADIARVQAKYPEALVHLLVTAGQWLSHLKHQDSYSFEVAELFLGASSQKELLAKYRDCLRLLPFELSPPEAA